jgi:hypothetical protein
MPAAHFTHNLLCLAAGNGCDFTRRFTPSGFAIRANFRADSA